MDVGDRSRVDERDAAIGLEASLTTGVGQLNLVIRRVGKDLQWASYVEDLNGRRSGDDYFPHLGSLREIIFCAALRRHPTFAHIDKPKWGVMCAS